MRKASPAPASAADLDPIAAAVAVAVVTKKLAAASPLPPGEYAVRGLLTLSLDGTVVKAAPYQAKPPAPLDAVRAVAAALLVAGVELVRVEALATKALTLAAESSPPQKEQTYRDVTAGVAERHKERLKAGMDFQEVQGATKVSGKAEVVSFTRGD